MQYAPPPKDKKEKKPEEAAAPKPKAEKKPKEQAEDDDDDKPFVEEPKAKNPLDSLPKSSLNLEDWRLFPSVSGVGCSCVSCSQCPTLG